MSLILDALNRADQERKTFDGAPDIHSIHAAPLASADAGRKRPLLWLLLIVALLAVAAALVWRMNDSPIKNVQPASMAAVAKPAPVSAPAGQSVSSVAVSPATPKPTPKSVASAEVAVPPTDAKVSDLYQAEEASSSVVAAENPVSELYQQEPPPAMAEAVQLPEVAAAIPADMAEPQRITGPVVEVKPRRLESVTGVPYFNDLPWGRKQQIPTISYARHDYLANGISTVVINGETRGVGNQVARGQFVIEDILEDGVVLRYGDQRFKLPALSGWVNM